MPSLDQLRQQHNQHRRAIRRRFHEEGSISHSQFHALLTAEEERFHQALIDAGFAAEVFSLTPTAHIAKVVSLDPQADRPLTVARPWEDHQVPIPCYVTQDLVDAFQAGTLSIGDFVFVVFADNDLDKPVATQRLYPTWE